MAQMTDHAEELLLAHPEYIVVVERTELPLSIRWDLSIILRRKRAKNLRARAAWVCWPDKGQRDEPPLGLMIEHTHYYLQRRKECHGVIGIGETIYNGVAGR